MCGEKYVTSTNGDDRWGSPPRVRGKVVKDFANAISLGITPACAGKSTTIIWDKKDDKDHPRVCGEKLKTQMCRFVMKGSPPRVRGKVSLCDGMSCGQRITPACAGKSSICGCNCTRDQDHPRVCGEKTKRSHTIGAFQNLPTQISFSLFATVISKRQSSSARCDCRVGMLRCAATVSSW